MGVTRLKRKDRKNKVYSVLNEQVKKRGTDKSIGSKAINTAGIGQINANLAALSKALGN